MAILNRSEVRDLYDGLADSYDRKLIGFRLLGLSRWRAELVERLCLVPGDTVIDLCCGAGENLDALRKAVGPEGRIVGVDLSGEMLKKAQVRAESLGMRNAEFIQGDVAEFSIPTGIAGVISTFGLEMVPEYDFVIRRIGASLEGRSRLGLLGVKYPEKWPRWLVAGGERFVRSFGATREYEEFTPWQAAERHMDVLHFREHVAGAVYSCVARVDADIRAAR